MASWNRDTSADVWKRRAEDAEYELSGLRERMDREREERERRQKAEWKERYNAMRPSNRLYNGDIDDFEEAMCAVAAAAREEMGAGRREGWNESEEWIDKLDASLQAYADAAHDALAIYREEYASFMRGFQEQVAKRLRQRALETANDGYDSFAAALEEGDYTRLAI